MNLRSFCGSREYAVVNTIINAPKPSTTESLSQITAAIEPSTVIERYTALHHSFLVYTNMEIITGSVTHITLENMFLFPMVVINSL